MEDPRIAGKVIILGGSYSACDQYKTPFGDRPGAEIVAAALEGELSPDRVSFMGSEKYLWKVVLALVIVALHTLLRPVPALMATVGLLALLVWQGVWIAFHFVNYRASVVPFLVAIVIEQMINAAEHAQHLGKDVEVLEAKVASAAQNFLSLREGAAALADRTDELGVSMSAQDLANAAKQYADKLQLAHHSSENKGHL